MFLFFIQDHSPSTESYLYFYNVSIADIYKSDMGIGVSSGELTDSSTINIWSDNIENMESKPNFKMTQKYKIEDGVLLKH